MNKGTIGILNIGSGDTKLIFDKDNPMERARSARIVADMLQRGYVLFIDTGNKNYQRVLQFDENYCEYIIADFAPIAHEDRGTVIDEPSREEASDAGSQEASEAPPRPKLKRGRKRVGAETTTGVAVARVAGG